MHTFVSVHSTHSKGELVVREVRVIAPLRNKTADTLFDEINGGDGTAAASTAAEDTGAEDTATDTAEEEETDEEEEGAWDGDTDEDAWDGA